MDAAGGPGEQGRPCRWGIVTKYGELKCLARPGTGARARGPVAVELTELGGVAGSGRGRKWRQRVPGRREVPPGRWRGPVVGPSSESSQDWSGTMAVPTSESASLVALARVAVRHSPGTYALSSSGGPRMGPLPASCPNPTREAFQGASPVGACYPRRGCWPYVTGLLVKPPAPGPVEGSGSLFQPGPGPAE